MIGFRVDANEKIATGHLMRCIAIAKACEKRGEPVLFFLAEKKETGRLDALGFSYEILGTDWQDMEGEMEKLEALVKSYSLNWLVVDSYQATMGYLKELEQFVKVLYLDDFGKECYRVSAVLNYHPWAEGIGVSGLYRDSNTRLLPGGRYVPLREEFSESFSDRGKAEREFSVLITTGGTDSYNMAGLLLQDCLGKKDWQEVVFHVIVGSMNSHQKQLQALAEKYPQVHLHKNVANMSEYMRRCQAAVSAGGTTLYELCACGLPTVCFSFADNQIPGTETMGRQGVMIYAGDVRKEADICGKIEKGILGLLNHPDKWERYSRKMREMTDGKGAERIAAFLTDVPGGTIGSSKPV